MSGALPRMTMFLPQLGRQGKWYVFYLIVIMSIGTHSLLGCGWESGKFYLIVMMPMAKHYIVLASGSTRRLGRLITVYFVCI